MLFAEFKTPLRFDDLKRCHKDYSPVNERTGVDALTLHGDLYEGGDRFYKNINKYLVPRAFEESIENPIASAAEVARVVGSDDLYKGWHRADGKETVRNSQYQRRAKRSAFAPIGSGILDFMKSAIFQTEVNFVVSQAAQEDADFWKMRNSDADGKGGTLDAVLQDVIHGVFLDFRSYLLLLDPLESTREGNTKKATGDLDTQIRYLCAKDVGDWELDDKGALAWVRVDKKRQTRAYPGGPIDTEERDWVFVTPTAFYTFSVKWLIKDGPPKDEKLIGSDGGAVHGFTYRGQPTLPVIKIPVKKGLHLMGRLIDIILAIFNRMSAKTWSLDQMAFAILVVCSEMSKENIGDQKFEDIAGLKLNIGNTATFESPDVAIHSAQSADLEWLIEQLSLVLQAMVLVAAAADDQGRKSGISKKLDFSALTTLLSAYARPVHEAVERAIVIIKEHRGEVDSAIEIQGLKNFSVQSIESMLANAAIALGLPGLPLAAKQWISKSVGLKIAEDAPDSVRDKVTAQANAMTDDDYEVATPIGQAEPNPLPEKNAA